MENNINFKEKYTTYLYDKDNTGNEIVKEKVEIEKQGNEVMSIFRFYYYDSLSEFDEYGEIIEDKPKKMRLFLND